MSNAQDGSSCGTTGRSGTCRLLKMRPQGHDGPQKLLERIEWQAGECGAGVRGGGKGSRKKVGHNLKGQYHEIKVFKLSLWGD